MSGGNVEDAFANFRVRPRRSFWTMSLEALEAGEVLSLRDHERVFELFPEDGLTLPVIDARGEVCLLASVPEMFLHSFEEGDWRFDLEAAEPDHLFLKVVVGETEPVELYFTFHLSDEQQRETAIRLSERPEVSWLGLTHFEEGIMLTLKGSVPLPPDFVEEWRGHLLRMLHV